MSSHGDQLKSAIGISALVSFYGIASMLVVFIGPKFGFGYTEQIIIIVLILLTWPFVVLFNYIRRRRSEKAEAKEATAAQAAQPGGDFEEPRTGAPPARVQEELAKGAEEAVQYLKSSRLGSKRSKDAVYALPWFLVAGPQSSGKSSLVLSSGFDFQALPSQHSSEQHTVKPTRNLHWRITNEAVFIDSAGRYQTEGPARDEWDAVLETIRKYREDRPLDGLLIAVNVSRILDSQEPEIEQQAKVLRARLDEILKRTHTRFPVYLIFTQADAIPGFREFCRPFNSNGRAQVWGATIPLEKALNAHALFDAEFDLLTASLMRKRLLRLGLPDPAPERVSVFDFPFSFASTRAKLGLFTSVLFRPNPFSESPLMRGFYFTATTPDETPTTAAVSGPNGLDSASNSVGRAYFSPRFFRDVLLSDKDLAASFQAGKRRTINWGTVGIIAASALLLILCAGLLFSFFANRALVQEALERGAQVDEITRSDVGKDPARKSNAEARIEIDAVDKLRETLSQLENYDKKSPPLYMRLGLYSGGGLIQALRTIYFDSVEQRFKKPTVAALEADLRRFAANKGAASAASDSANEEVLGHNYDLLKAYLMLADANKVEPTFLADQLTDYWKRFSPAEMETASQQQLNFLARELATADSPHIKVDDRLVAEVRQRLVAYPASSRVYKRITTEVNGKTPSVNLDSILEGRGRSILVSANTIPGSYTIEGYRKFIVPRLESAGEEISKEDWVMGSQASSSRDQGADVGKLQSMYFREYADQWHKFVKSISVKEFRTKDDAVEVLKSLSSSDSPMERVLIAVEHHTNFSAKPKTTTWWEWFKSFFVTPSNDDSGGAYEPEKEFRPVIDFVNNGSGKESSALTQYRAALKRVLDPLQNVSQSQLQQTSEALLTGKDDLGLQRAEVDVSNLTEPFKTTPSSSDAAALLNAPLGNLRALLYGSGYAVIEKTWRDQIYPQARALESGFPFTDSGESSVTDLARFINPVNGQFTDFFNKQLAQSFDNVNGEWKLKESGAVKYSDDFVKYLNGVRRLREGLFPNGGQTPQVQYGIELQPVADADVSIEVDGQRVESAGTKSASFAWPARPGSQTGAVIKVLKSNTAASSTAAVGQQTPTDSEPLVFPGDWGLFRMIAAGSANGSGGSQFNLTWNVNGVQVKAVLKPASASNPFNRSLFTSLHAPPGLQK